MTIDGSQVSKKIWHVKTLTPRRVRLARFIAIGADFLQIALFPMLAPGFISPFDDGLDVVVCLALTWLVGWHYSFLPSFVVKVVPMADMVPSWTLAIFLATRQKQMPPQPIVTEVYAEPVAPPLIAESSESRGK